MLVTLVEDCIEFVAGDGSLLRELLHPDKADVQIRYSLAHATVPFGQATKPHRLTTAEVYYVIEGFGTMCIDDESEPVEYDGQVFDSWESLEEYLEQWPLSVEVRSDWRSIGDDNDNPTEYRILLATGGPAVQIIGELDKYGEPKTARIQGQDWFTPWETYAASDPETLDAVLDFARLFYFVNH